MGMEQNQVDPGPLRRFFSLIGGIHLPNDNAPILMGLKRPTAVGAESIFRGSNCFGELGRKANPSKMVAFPGSQLHTRFRVRKQVLGIGSRLRRLTIEVLWWVYTYRHLKRSPWQQMV